MAVIDSGIASHSDLSGSYASRVVANVNFVPNEAYAWDLCGHGTHVAGILAGNGNLSTGQDFKQTYYGVARKANLVNLRVLNSSGQGSVSSVVAAVQWAVQNKGAYNIRVMNLSIGHPIGESYTTDPLCQAVESAWRAGIVVVVAAGNEGRLQNTPSSTLNNEGYGTNYGSIQSPGNDPYVITVGAMKNIDAYRAHDRVATYSSRGPSRLDLVLKPDIVAPGNKIVSLAGYNGYLLHNYGATNIVPWYAYRYSEDSTAYSTDYFVLSGTSMATPVVSGAAAMLLEKYPSLSPDTIKARLMLSADKWADPNGNMDPCTYGAGYLNIPAALACTAAPNQSAMSPEPEPGQQRQCLHQHGSGDLGNGHQRHTGNLGRQQRQRSARHLGQNGYLGNKPQHAQCQPSDLGKERLGRPGDLGNQQHDGRPVRACHRWREFHGSPA